MLYASKDWIGSLRLMTLKHARLGAFILAATLFVCGAVMMPKRHQAFAQSGPPPADIMMLGRMIFRDRSLSNPGGQACINCHDPEAGWSSPNSADNATIGVARGVIPNRFGPRKIPGIGYAASLPMGIPTYNEDAQGFVGGLFYDGRAKDLVDQAKAPFLNPNEMNNDSPAMVIAKLQASPSANMFKQVFGADVFTKPVDEVYDLMAKALAAYQSGPELSPYNSKYDLYLEGKAALTPSEMGGLRLVTGTLNGRPDGPPFPRQAFCSGCHGRLALDLTKEKDHWTNSCYANIGVPKNRNNPFYAMTDAASNPKGYNPLGDKYVDFGLSFFLYPYMGLPVNDPEGHDRLGIVGAFKAPTLRNVGKRPHPGFVKSYMHNGALKSLEEVVHFYTSRNWTTEPGEIIDFTQADPYAGLIGTPLWDAPEYIDPVNMINPTGLPGADESTGGGMVSAEVGNLFLKPSDEADIVAFLNTLNDNYHDVAGSIWFKDFEFGNYHMEPVQVEVRKPGTSQVLHSAVIFTDFDGFYNFNPNVPPGLYDIAIKPRHFLREVVENVQLQPYGAMDVNVGVSNGDVDGDNEVTILDYSILSDFFDKTADDADWTQIGGNGFRPIDADLDGDGTVSVFDYSILSDNFGLNGEA